MIRRGSPNSLGVLTSVASTSPLRSTISGRAVAIASCAAVRRAPWLRADREHDQPAADHRIDATKARIAKPTRARALGGAIDIARRTAACGSAAGATIPAGRDDVAARSSSPCLRRRNRTGCDLAGIDRLDHRRDRIRIVRLDEIAAAAPADSSMNRRIGSFQSASAPDGVRRAPAAAAAPRAWPIPRSAPRSRRAARAFPHAAAGRARCARSTPS